MRPPPAAPRTRAPWRSAILAGVAAWLAASCSAPSGEPAAYTTTKLADGLFLLSGPDGNVVTQSGPDGLLVVNGGAAKHARALERALQDAAGRRKIAVLIDTDWKPEHVGLNAVAGGQGAKIVAHFNAKQWLAYGAKDLATGEGYPPLPEKARPTELVSDDGAEIAFAGGPVKLGYLLQAHTDADLYVYFPKANVLVTGAAVRSDGWSMVNWPAGAYLGGLDDALKTLGKVGDDKTIVVPGSGPVITKADLAAQGQMYADLFMKVAKLVLTSKSPVEAVAAHPTGEYHPEWTDADEFVDRAQRSYRTHIRRDPRLPAIP
jgi:glyoxylase-like metal-dependent hydrolase (beta-lactamase superfamily II)